MRDLDRALDDEDLVDSVLEVLRRRWPQSSRRGRHGTPAETVLRTRALKHLMDWSHDELEREVTDSLVYRRFCRIDAGKVPDAKTMVRLGQLSPGNRSTDFVFRCFTYGYRSFLDVRRKSDPHVRPKERSCNRKE